MVGIDGRGAPDVERLARLLASCKPSVLTKKPNDIMRFICFPHLLAIAFFVFTSSLLAGQSASEGEATASVQLDAYLDSRFEAEAGATEALLTGLAEAEVQSPAALETLLLSPRTAYPDPPKLTGEYTTHPIDCYHVDYSSKFVLYVPKGFDPKTPAPLVVVGHGGNSSMNAKRAMKVAQQYIRIYAPGLTQGSNAIIAAPASERGWGPIGYSLVFSTISKVKRMLPVDSNRIYLTGQSMGGHLTYRMALMFGDRFGAVSPHSGGYDFAAKGSIGNLLNVPGRAIFGSTEPYGINGDNKTNETWAKEHGLDWSFVEKDGGHAIYEDELPGLAAFFLAHPRDPYPERVYLKQGGSMLFTKTWGIEGWPDHTVRHETRPMRWNRRHWVEVQPDTTVEGAQELVATNLGENKIQITCNKVRNLTLFLHPKMVDFAKPVTVVVNGKTAFEGEVKADMGLMLDRARVSDDRGQVYWAKVRVVVDTDSPVEL